MLKLSLAAKQGNGVRYFPHAGYLRLTPLKIEGIVRTKIDEDNKPLLCSNLYVALRCYESRLGLGLGLTSGSSGSSGSVGAENGTGVGNGNPNPNVLFEIVVPLWKAAEGSEHELLGNGEWPFRIIVPPNASPVCSTVHFQEYRVCWRVEAVLTHVPITGVGLRLVKMHDIPLMRYDAGQDLPPQPPNKWRRVSLPSRSPKLHPSTLKYIINTPPFPLAPLDCVPVTLKVSPPPGVDVTSITLSIERRLTFIPSHSPTLNTLYGFNTDAESTSNHMDTSSSQTSFKAASTMVITSTTIPLTLLDRQPGHVSYTSTITLQIPQAKSLSHWSLGETIHTPLASVRFFLKSRITLLDSRLPEDAISPSPCHPQSSTSSLISLSPTQSAPSTLDLQEKELYVIATNEADRREAISKYREAVRRGKKRKINVPGKENEKEKESTALPPTALDPNFPSPTPLTFEPHSSITRGRGRPSSQSIFQSRSKSKSCSRKFSESAGIDNDNQRAINKAKGKERERDFRPSSPSPSPSPGVDFRLSDKKFKRPNTSEGKTNVDIISGEINCPTSDSKLKSKAKSKSKKRDTIHRSNGLMLGFLTPRSRKFSRQYRASDGDGNDDYDGDYVFVDNEVPLSAPPVRRPSRHKPISPYPVSLASPYETSADESRKVTYFRDERGVADSNISTNASTGTTTSTTTSEDITGPPTPLDESEPHPPQLRVHTSYSCRPLALPATLQPSRSWITLPRPLPFLDSLGSSTPTSTSAPVSTPWGNKGVAERYGKETWEIELENRIAAGNVMKADTGKEHRATTDASGKVPKFKIKKSSTIAAMGFRKNKKRNSGAADNGDRDIPDLNISPTSCSESDSYPTLYPPLSRLSPPSPAHILSSPSPALDSILATASTPVSPLESPVIEPKPKSKSRTRTLGFKIGWGFGWD